MPHKKNGRIIWQWEVIAKDKRNEPLDLRGYNLACLKSINPDFEKLKTVITAKNVENNAVFGLKTADKTPKPAEKSPRKPVYGCIKRGGLGGL